MAPDPFAFAGYELLDQLGDGASGVVYRATQLSTRQLVAIKVLRHDVHQAADVVRMRARFEREMELCATLHHPHIVRLLDRGESAEGEPFAVFEFVPGETLHSTLLREGALSASEAGELMGQVLDALVAAHAAGIIHRDLKPHNIMVSRSGARRNAKVLDYGIGTFTSGAFPARLHDLTLTCEALGTPRYSAPEQLRGEPPTARSDIYSWALIVLECLTGTPVVNGQTLAEVYHTHLSPAELVLPAALLRHPLGDVLRHALAKQPNRRAASAASLLAQFSAIHFANLVGTFACDGRHAGMSETDIVSGHRLFERKQITMLSYTLLCSDPGQAADAERADAELSERLQVCADICSAWGGFAAGGRGSGRLVYFGYPQASDQAGRAAGCAAIELLTRCLEYNGGVETGLLWSVRAAIHTSTFVISSGVPSGRAVDELLELELRSASNEALVSEAAAELLGRHFLLEPRYPSLASHVAAPQRVFRLLVERASDAEPEFGSAFDSPPFTGRSLELEAIAEAWAACSSRTGVGSALMLIGEAGVGKSRLAQEARTRARAMGAEAFVLRCTPEQRNTALFPFSAWLRAQLYTEAGGDGAAATDVLMRRLDVLGFDWRDVGPLMCSWLDLPSASDISPICHAPMRQRQLVIDVFCALLTRAARATALLVLEDVHWIDPTSRELVDTLLRRGLPEGLMLILTTREEGGYRPNVPTVLLTGLTPVEANDLLIQLLPPSVMGEAPRLLQRAEGNPLYLAELARACAAESEAQSPPRLDTPAQLPGTLRDLLSQALDRIGLAKHTSQCAAAQGREFDSALLAETAQLSPDVAGTHLEQMRLAGLVVPHPEGGHGIYSFRHALLRDAAYESMAQSSREEVHLRIAGALRARLEAAHDLRALHYAAARRYELAVREGTSAAAMALSRGLQDESLAQVRLVKKWLPRLGAEAQRLSEIDLELVATQGLMSKYGWADARVRAAAERSHTLLRDVDDSERAGAALWALATFHHVASDRARVRTLVEQLHALASSSPSPVLRRAACTMHGMANWIDGAFVEAAENFETVLRGPVAEGAADAARLGLDCRCWSMAALANVRWFLDDQEGARSLAAKAIAQARELNHIPTLGLCLMYSSFLRQHEGDRPGALLICEELEALSLRYGLPAVEAYCAIIKAWALQDPETVAQVIRGLDALGCNLGQTYFGTLHAELAISLGRRDEALTLVDAMLSKAAVIDERYFVPELWLLRARCLLEVGSGTAKQEARCAAETAAARARAAHMIPTLRRASLMLQRFGAKAESSMRSLDV